MGELLQHDILNSLQDSKDAWLIHLLQAFNCGDIKTFKSTSAQWRSQPDLKVSRRIYYMRITLSRSLGKRNRIVGEDVFNVPDGNDICPSGQWPRNLLQWNFRKDKSAQNWWVENLTLDKNIILILDVESLVMRALSLDLVKGMIDEVDEKVHMTWVQPRVLNTEQVGFFQLIQIIAIKWNMTPHLIGN